MLEALAAAWNAVTAPSVAAALQDDLYALAVNDLATLLALDTWSRTTKVELLRAIEPFVAFQSSPGYGDRSSPQDFAYGPIQLRAHEGLDLLERALAQRTDMTWMGVNRRPLQRKLLPR